MLPGGLSMVCLSQEGVRSCLDGHGYTTDEVVIDERKSACRGLKCFEDASDHSDGSWLEAFGSRCEASQPGNHPAIPRRQNSRSTGRNKVLHCTVRSAVVRKHGSEGQCVMHSICEERGLLKPHGALEEAGLESWSHADHLSLRPGLGAAPRSPLRRGTDPTCD
jgi:hypothetical protein